MSNDINDIYNNYAKKCEKPCSKCFKSRMILKGETYSSCDGCYKGKNYSKDKFEFSKLDVYKYIWKCVHVPIYTNLEEVIKNELITKDEKDPIIKCYKNVVSYYNELNVEPLWNLIIVPTKNKNMIYRLYHDRKLEFIWSSGKIRKIVVVCKDEFRDKNIEIAKYLKKVYPIVQPTLTKKFGDITKTNDEFMFCLAETYNSFVLKCNKDCKVCKKNRLIPYFTTKDDIIFGFCFRCYNGKDYKTETLALESKILFENKLAFCVDGSNKFELAMYNFIECLSSVKTMNGIENLQIMIKEDNPEFTWKDVNNLMYKNKK
jgi:hypothetical protein